MKAERRSVDLSHYPDLVVIYLGYRVGGLRSLRALMGMGRGLAALQRDPPDGLLLHEGLFWGWRHPGFRQYWRDFESLEAFTRAPRHAGWWRDFMRDSQGGGIWHETYRMRGGVEAIYAGMPPLGLARFAPARQPVGPFMSARQRVAS
jgi:hypothetical protein